MGGEWCLSVERLCAGSFTDDDQRKWELACEVLQDLARFRDFHVATKPEEEDHQYPKTTACSNCSNSKCSKAFKVWHPVRYGDITVPTSLNGALNLCAYENRTSPLAWSQKPVFAIHGCVRWATNAFCSDLESIIAYLFPGKFQVTWDMYYVDRDDTEQVYCLDDENGEAISKLPGEFSSRIRDIKRSV